MDSRLLVLDTNSYFFMQMADDALAQAGIPHFIIEFTKSGQSLEMPCAPKIGRGYRWNLTVSEEHHSAAEALLKSLPLENSIPQDPSDGSLLSPKAKRWRNFYRILCIGFLVLIGLLFWFSKP